MHLSFCYKTPLYHVFVIYQNSGFLIYTLKVLFLYRITTYCWPSTFFIAEDYLYVPYDLKVHRKSVFIWKCNLNSHFSK